MGSKETKQFLIYYRPDSEGRVLARRMYIAGSAKEAASAFVANMPKATWTEIFEMVPALTNEYVRT